MILEIIASAIIAYLIGLPVVKLIHSRKEIDNDRD